MVEQELSRTLHDRAEAAGPVPGDLSTILSTARRRRRRRAIVPAVAIVLAVALVSGGLGVAWWDRSPYTGLAPASKVSPSPLGPAVGKARPPAANAPVRPADKVWPEAVIRMPTTDPTGAKAHPITMLDSTHVLVSAETSFQKQSALRMYDTKTRKFSAITDLNPIGDLHDYYPQDFANDDRTVVWDADGVDSSGHHVVQFLAADLSGGHKRLLASIPGSLSVTELELVDHKYVVYSEPLHGGVYRVPLGGGSPQKVAGSTGMFLAVWPWASDVNGFAGTDRKTTATLRNLVTGDTQVVHDPGTTFWDCVPSLCVGDAGTDASVVVDGPDSHTAAPDYVRLTDYFVLNRFVDAAYDDGKVHNGGWVHGDNGRKTYTGKSLPHLLWDVKTGTVATYPLSRDGAIGLSHHSGMLAWHDPDHAGQQIVLDLAAVR
jgi:hypothetical protein